MADWSQLPKELLHGISERLESPLYLLRFRSVCSSWRSASSSPVPKHRTSPSEIPNPIRSSASPFYLSKCTLFLIKLPQHQRQTLYPSHPWLIKIARDPRGRTRILHPLSRSLYDTTSSSITSNLPEPCDIYQLPALHLGHEFVLKKTRFNLSYMKKVVFACLGSLGFALLTVHVNGKLALFRSCDEAWTIIPHVPAKRYNDVCVFRGKLCAVDDTGRTVVVGLDSSVVLVAKPVLGRGDKKYLVECEGKLLLVDIYYEIGSKRVKRINVFRLDEEEKKWVELKSLEGWVLFLGEDSSFSVSVSDLCVGRGNCVIFNDVTMQYGLCVFHLDEVSIKAISHYPGYYKLFWPPQYWL